MISNFEANLKGYIEFNFKACKITLIRPSLAGMEPGLGIRGVALLLVMCGGFGLPLTLLLKH